MVPIGRPGGMGRGHGRRAHQRHLERKGHERQAGASFAYAADPGRVPFRRMRRVADGLARETARFAAQNHP